eukprot:4113122-Pyramimonas_sp.AAC.1
MLMAASEAIGMLPKQLCWIQMPLLGQPSGGNRLTILHVMMYRVWLRARKSMAAQMHADLDRRYRDAGKGRSAIYCARLQAVRSGSNQAAHKHGVVIVADWSKYYESIPLLELKHKFLRHGAPTAWLKLVFNMWTSPRVIILGRNHATTPLIARYGLPAGDGYSDLAIKVHAVDAPDIFAQRAPT